MTATAITRPAISGAPQVTPRNGPPALGTATILSGASLSNALALEDFRLARIFVPVGWTAAVLTFRVSHDDVTYADLYDASGTEYTVQAAASRAILIPIVDFLGVQYLKVRSGTSAAAVNQGADRALKLVLG